MSKKKRKEEKYLLNIADQFINLANEQVAKRGKPEYVSVALRYAAARFNAHEINIYERNLAEARDKAISWYTEQCRIMFTENINELIELNKNKKTGG